MSIDDDLQKMMRDLESLARAITASSQTGGAVRRFRHQGYSLYLALERKDESSDVSEAHRRTDTARVDLTANQTSVTKPGFLLNQGDVSFLESVGIDATRPGRRRRTP